ncbi:MAG TPA: isoprenylcysteine carboxylmethyltransferase family protein [Anaerolineales bacterium]|nr:isoprenylcysteine carboxylmethyltransferase family protein [Anaerolineales bacterium]
MSIPTLLGYFLLVVFFYLETRLRRGDQAKSRAEGQFDRKTTRYLGYAYFVSIMALLAAWVLNALGIGLLPSWVPWLGVLLALGGLLMRTWANHVLGGYYTRTLKVLEGQMIVQAGPYRFIRHPGYLGMILMWIGVSASTGNWIVILIVLCAILSAYHYRIQNEEEMLLHALPGYADYSSRTWRLIPLLY